MLDRTESTAAWCHVPPAPCPAVTSRGKMEACPRSPSKNEPLDGVAGVLLGPPQGQVAVPAGQLAFQRSDSTSYTRMDSWRPEKDELFAGKDALWRHSVSAGKRPPAVATRMPAAGGGASAAKPPRSGGSAGAATSRRTSSDRRSGEHPRGGSSSAGSVAGTSIAGSTAGSAASSPYGSPFAHASQQSAEYAFSPAPGPSQAGGTSDAAAAGSAAADAGEYGHGSRAAAPAAASLARTAVPAQQDQQQALQEGCRNPTHQHSHHQQEGCSCAPAPGGLHVQLQAAAREEPVAAADTAGAGAAAVMGSAAENPAVRGRPAAASGLGAFPLGDSSDGTSALNRVIYHDMSIFTWKE